MRKHKFRVGSFALCAAALVLACSAADDESGEPVDSVTAQLPPARPMGIAPTGSIGSNPTYTWVPSADSATYRLWVDDGAALQVVDQTFTAAAAGCPLGTEPQCSFTPGVDLAPGYGQWWVQAINAGGEISIWSPGLNFFVTSVTTLVAPSGSITDSTPTYTWNSVPGAANYQLWVIDTAASPTINQTVTAAAACAGGVCSVTPATVIAEGAATWYIKPDSGNWSAGMNFSLDLCPAGCDDGNTCTLDSCTAGVGCNHTPVVDGTGCDDGSACSTTEYCHDGKCGTREGDADFAACRPTAIGPTGDLGTNYSPTYSWNPVPNVTTYRLWIADASVPVGGASFIQIYTDAEAGCAGGVGTCAVTPSNVLANGAGKWWVQSPPHDDTIFMHGPYSFESNFSIGIATGPVGVSPVGGATTTASPTFTWQPVPGMNHVYQINVQDSTGALVVDATVAEAAAGCPNGTGTCSYTPGVTLAAGSGTWWVRDTANGPWSSDNTFTVTP